MRALHDRLEAGLVAGGQTTRHRYDTTLDYAGAGVPKNDGSVFRGGATENRNRAGKSYDPMIVRSRVASFGDPRSLMSGFVPGSYGTWRWVYAPGLGLASWAATYRDCTVPVC